MGLSYTAAALAAEHGRDRAQSMPHRQQDTRHGCKQLTDNVLPLPKPDKFRHFSRIPPSDTWQRVKSVRQKRVIDKLLKAKN